MTRQHAKAIGLIWLVGLLLVACGGQAIPSASAPDSAHLTMTATALPSSTAAPPDLPPPTATLTPPPPFIPAGIGTPIPEHLTPLTPSNAEHLTLLALWGKGAAGPAAWTADGRALIVPSGQGVHIYDAQTLEAQRTLPLVSWQDYASRTVELTLVMGTQIEIAPEVLYASTSAHQVAISPDGRWLAVGFADGIGKVRVVDMLSSAVVAVVDEPHPLSIAFSPDGRYLAVGARGFVSLWEITPEGPRTEQWFARLESGNTEAGDDIPAFTALRFSPDSTWLAAIPGNHDKGYLWRVEVGEHLPTRVLQAKEENVDAAQALVFSPDGAQIVLGGNDGALRLWDLHQGTLYTTQPTDATRISALAFAPTGHLWIGTLSGDVLEWDLAEQRTVAHWCANTSLQEVTQIALSPDGSRLLIQKAGSLLEVWDVASGQQAGAITAHWGLVRASAYAAQANLLALAVADTVIVVDAATGIEKQRLVGGGHTISDIAITPDGRWLIAAYEDEAIKLWDISTGKVRSELHPPSAKTVHLNTAVVAVSPTSTYAASLGYEEDAVTLWNPNTGQVVRTLTGAPQESTCITFDTTGERLLAASASQGVVRAWDVTSGRLIADFPLKAGAEAAALPPLSPRSARWAPDGTTLLISSLSIPPLVALDANTGEVMWFGEGEGLGNALNFSPDGQLVTAGELLLDGHTGAALKVIFLAGEESLGEDSYFSADGTRLYVVTSNGCILVWGIPKTP